MPTLETGNDAGFTLIEILAVIILIGLVFALAFPNFILSEERTEIIHIGKLISGDLKLVQEDSQENRTDGEVEFTGNGYRFMLGTTDFTRTFNRFGFTFQLLDETEDDKSDEHSTKKAEQSTQKGKLTTNEWETDQQINNAASESQSDEIGNQKKENTDKGVEEDDSNPDAKDAEKSDCITFNEDGATGKLELNWQSNHFKGKLTIDETGKVKWNYGKR